jgi:hypothetical protein
MGKAKRVETNMKLKVIAASLLCAASAWAAEHISTGNSLVADQGSTILVQSGAQIKAGTGAVIDVTGATLRGFNASSGSVTKFSFLNSPGITGVVSTDTTTPQLSLTITENGVSGLIADLGNKEHTLTFSPPLARTVNAVSIPQADGTHNGYLLQGDWNTFNGKQSALTFPKSIVNSSGAVSLVNDMTSPGNSQYYGTNGSGVRGFFAIPAGASLPDPVTPTHGGSGANLSSTGGAHKVVQQTSVGADFTVAQLSSTDLGDFSTTAPVSTGQIPIFNASTGKAEWGDPYVQGTKAEGAVIDNPVTIGGKDGSGNNKALVLDSSGRPTVNVNGSVTVTIADGSLASLGNKADAKSTATDTTAASLISIAKEISYMEQNPASQAVTNAGTFATQAAQSGSWTVTANAGTNLNTSALALDATLTGGTQRTKLTDGTNNVGVGTSNVAGDETATDRLKVNAALRLLDTSLTAGAQLVAAKGDQTSGLWVNVKNTPAVSQSGTWTVQPGNTANTTAWLVTGTGGTFPATQSGTWNVRNQDGAGNALTSNSTTYTAKFGLDANLLGTLGTAFSTAGKVDVKSADGDVFVRSNAGSTFPVNATLQTQTDTVMVGGVNIKEINAVTPLMGNGVTGTGSQRVTIASDNTAFSVNATLSAETTKVIGTVRNLGNGGATMDAVVGAGTAPTNGMDVLGVYNSTELSPTTGQSASLQLDSKGRLRNVIMDAAGNTRGANVNASSQLSVSLDNVAYNTGTRSATTQRVTISTDDIVPVSQSGTWTVQPGNTANTTPWLVAGAAASGATVSGNPLLQGGRAQNAEATTVTNGQAVASAHDLAGKQIVLPYANSEKFVSGAITTAMTGTTSTSLIAAPASGLRNYITQITVSNAHATVGTDVIIQDGSGGTTLYTIPAAAAYGGATITFPTPLRQPTTATAIFCANVTTGASTKVSASGYKGY